MPKLLLSRAPDEVVRPLEHLAVDCDAVARQMRGVLSTAIGRDLFYAFGERLSERSGRGTEAGCW